MNPEKEINSQERDKFWEREEQEEKLRQAEEKKRKQEELLKLEQERKQREVNLSIFFYLITSRIMIDEGDFVVSRSPAARRENSRTIAEYHPNPRGRTSSHTGHE